MNPYEFYISHIRFIVKKTEQSTDAITTMMSDLSGFADQIEAGNDILISPDSVRSLGRGLAGVAGFLQQHILPEAIAAENEAAQQQVRWVIDTSMSLMAALTVHAETIGDKEPCRLTLPAPPVLQ